MTVAWILVAAGAACSFLLSWWYNDGHEFAAKAMFFIIALPAAAGYVVQFVEAVEFSKTSAPVLGKCSLKKDPATGTLTADCVKPATKRPDTRKDVLEWASSYAIIFVDLAASGGTGWLGLQLAKQTRRTPSDGRQPTSEPQSILDELQ
jgi:hypothetical protein